MKPHEREAVMDRVAAESKKQARGKPPERPRPSNQTSQPVTDEEIESAIDKAASAFRRVLTAA